MPKKGEKLTSARLLKHNRPPDDPDGARSATFGAAAAQLSPDQIETPKQQELLAAPEQATKPSPVQNGRLLSTYVGLGLERDKDNEKLAHLDFSFPLEDAHDGFLPKKVKAALEWLKDQDNKLVQITGIPPVTLDIFHAPSAKKPELHLPGAEFTKAIISVIEEVGKGKAKLVWRFAFRLRVERTDEVIAFAAWHDGEEFWVTMPPTQGKLV